MIKYTCRFTLYFIRKSGLFYFVCLLALYILYQQTIGLDFIYDEQLIIKGLWLREGYELADYLLTLVLNGLFFSIFGLILLVQLSSAFFSDHHLSNVLVKKPERERFLLYFFGILVGIISIVLLMHYTIISLYIFWKTGMSTFLQGYWTYIFNLIPVITFLASTVLFFTVLSKNSFSRVSLVIGYLILASFILEDLSGRGTDLPTLLEIIVEYRQYIAPFFLRYMTTALYSATATSMGVASTVVWHAAFVPAGIFLAASTYLFNKKVL